MLPPGWDLRMGNGVDAVVDAQLRLCGVAGLRIADASVVPVVPTPTRTRPFWLLLNALPS